MRKGRNIRKITLPTNIKLKYTKTKKFNKLTKTNVNYRHTVDLNLIKKDKDLDLWISEQRIGIVFHMYYADVLDEIISNLKSFNFNFDLWIVYPKSSKFERVLVKCKEKLKSFNPQYITCKNAGKDIGGKLTVLNHFIKENINYDYVLFAHDKKSPHTKNGEEWRRSLYSGIFNGANLIFNGFRSHKNIKMCGPTVRQGVCMSRDIAVNLKNYPLMKEILSLYFSRNIPHNSAFVAGTMFWVEWNFFKDIFSKINIETLISRLEHGDVREPSYAHAMERVFGLLVTMNNFKIGKI